MTDKRTTIVRACLAVLLATGLGLTFVGVAVEPFMPVAALDRVLTPTELNDPQKVRVTLDLLHRAQGNRWLAWCLAGFVVSALSVVGLWATHSMEPRGG